MNDTAARARDALEELVAELRHADELIGDQQGRIEELEAEVDRLQVALQVRKAAA